MKVNISDASSVNQRRERQILTEEQNNWYISLKNTASQKKNVRKKLLRDLVGLYQEQFFVARKGCIKGCSKIFIFPAKKLRKIRVLIIRLRRFFFLFCK